MTTSAAKWSDATEENSVIVVYAFSTPNSIRVPIALEELGLEYELKSVNVRQGEIQYAVGDIGRLTTAASPIPLVPPVITATLFCSLDIVASSLAGVRRGVSRLRTRVLQRRALYQACLYGAFSLFWTTVPLLLTGPTFHMTQNGVALFALAGCAGAIAAPIAGRIADKGWTRPATAFAIFAVAAALLVARFAAGGSRVDVALLVGAAILLDFGMTANLTLGQRAIFVLGAEFTGRFNGLYMSVFFVGGAIGSAVGGWAFATAGWVFASWIGFAFPLVALIFFLTERRRTSAESSSG
jgi:predicted MFS family arabinose efflux permease